MLLAAARGARADPRRIARRLQRARGARAAVKPRAGAGANECAPQDERQECLRARHKENRQASAICGTNIQEGHVRRAERLGDGDEVVHHPTRALKRA